MIDIILNEDLKEWECSDCKMKEMPDIIPPPAKKATFDKLIYWKKYSENPIDSPDQFVLVKYADGFIAISNSEELLSQYVEGYKGKEWNLYRRDPEYWAYLPE